MKLNERQFSKAVLVLSNDVNRKLLFALYRDNAINYSDLVKIILEFKGWKGGSAKCAYYIRKLVTRKIIKKEQRYYYLTKFGLAITKLVYDLQKECMEYDLDDCDADGKIMVMVKRK